MSREQRLFELLAKELAPEGLSVVNKSHLHSGHAGDDGTGETHFLVEIKSVKLAKMSRVAAQREVNRAVKSEFESGLHALEIKVL